MTGRLLSISSILLQLRNGHLSLEAEEGLLPRELSEDMSLVHYSFKDYENFNK